MPKALRQREYDMLSQFILVSSHSSFLSYVRKYSSGLDARLPMNWFKSLNETSPLCMTYNGILLHVP